MRFATWTVAVVMAAAVLTACQEDASKTRPVLPTPSARAVDRIRQEYAKINPDARVGVVKGVKVEINLAAVGDMPMDDLVVGDVITFLDANCRTITMGHIEAIDTDKKLVDVKYDAPKPDGRIPAMGDIAVRAIK